MNFITSSTAYSLYPFSTYCHKTSLVCGGDESSVMTAIEKYGRLGWSPEFAYTDYELMTNVGIQKKICHIGDGNCWVHHNTTQRFTTYEENTKWHIQYQRDYLEVTDDGEVIIAGYYYLNITIAHWLKIRWARSLSVSADAYLVITSQVVPSCTWQILFPTCQTDLPQLL